MSPKNNGVIIQFGYAWSYSACLAFMHIGEQNYISGALCLDDTHDSFQVKICKLKSIG